MQKTSDNDTESVILDKYPRLLPSIITVLDHVNPLSDLFMESLLEQMNEVMPSVTGKGSVLRAIDIITMNGARESWPTYDIPCMQNEVYKVIDF